MEQNDQDKLMDQEKIFSLYKFDENTFDITLKFFSIINHLKEIKSKMQPIVNYLGVMINTKHVLFQESNWSLSNDDIHLRFQIKELMRRIFQENANSKIFSNARIYGFNSHLHYIGDENCSNDYDQLEKKLSLASKRNYCDVVPNLSLFYNEISSYISNKNFERSIFVS
jgi:hypothetical protein